VSEELRTASPAVNGRTGVLDGLAAVIEAVAMAAFIIMMLATLLQVAVRYLEVALDWTEELARILFLASVMLGMAVAIRRRDHIVVDVVYAKLPPRVRNVLATGFDVGVLVLLIVWLRGALRLMELNAGTTFVMLPWVQVSYLYAVEAAAILLMILFVTADMAARSRRAVTGAARP
jgi:TRAP-type C4-dicarboxylate transport system permease small subunit